MKQVNQSQTQRFVSRFEHPALLPRLHLEGFLNHYTSTKDYKHKGVPNSSIALL